MRFPTCVVYLAVIAVFATRTLAEDGDFDPNDLAFLSKGAFNPFIYIPTGTVRRIEISITLGHDVHSTNLVETTTVSAFCRSLRRMVFDPDATALAPRVGEFWWTHTYVDHNERTLLRIGVRVSDQNPGTIVLYDEDNNVVAAGYSGEVAILTREYLPVNIPQDEPKEGNALRDVP